jgi:uncharacterized membrane protein
MRHQIYRFWRGETGAISLLLLLLFPLIVFVGGIATDISQLNVQKRHLQGQADMAAQSGARYLGDAAEVRRVVREVSLANERFPTAIIEDGDIEFGVFTSENVFSTAGIDQASGVGADAIRVTVRSEFNPLLLAPFIDLDEAMIVRRAVGQQNALVAFTLRNRLLSLDTSRSILDPLVGEILQVNTSLIDYNGLLNTDASLNELLSIASLEAGVGALTYDELLDVTVGLPSVVALISDALPSDTLASGSIQIGQIIDLSPRLANVNLGALVPDLSVNAFELLTAIAQLRLSQGQPLTVGAGLNLSPLAGVNLELSVIDPGESVLGFVRDEPPLMASVAQIDASLKADVANLLRLNLALQGASAEATLLSLNCNATEASDILATFRVVTSAAGLGLTATLLDERPATSSRTGAPVAIAGSTQTVSVTLGQYQSGEPIPVPNVIQVSSLTNSLTNVLSALRGDLEAERSQCSGFLGVLLCPLLNLVGNLLSILSDLISSLTSLIANALLLDGIVQAVLDILGIELAQAEIILDDYKCGSRLVQ